MIALYSVDNRNHSNILSHVCSCLYFSKTWLSKYVVKASLTENFNKTLTRAGGAACPAGSERLHIGSPLRGKVGRWPAAGSYGWKGGRFWRQEMSFSASISRFPYNIIKEERSESGNNRWPARR